MSDWQNYLEEHRGRFLDELLELLRIPSISSLADHMGDVETAARWVAARLTAAGVDGVEILPTGGHPVVYGEVLKAPGKPTVLIYGHFDVQPVDPISQWTTPPFAPEVRDGKIFARGASDDKGNMLIPILAAEALLRTEGTLPINVKFFFEGQEEIGSPQLPGFVAEHREKLACDMVVSADSGQWSETEGGLLVSLRGLCALQVDVRGARTDLHSGIYGGAVRNPIHALAEMLAALHDADGRVTVDGFYDAVLPLSEAERAQLAEVPLDEEKFREQVGAPALFGEAGYSTYERVGARPTLEINGIWGGFQGEGTKTVLPNAAHAKITCRLVANQDPDDVAEKVRAHLLRRTPSGVTTDVQILPGSARPYLMPGDHPGSRAAEAVLTALYGRRPYPVRVGGSVPVCELFQKHLGVYTVGFGFGLDDEQFHAPDEFFRISSFEKGPVAYCQLFERLAEG